SPRAGRGLRGTVPSRIGFVWKAGGWDPGRSIPTELMKDLFQRLMSRGVTPCILQRGLSASELTALPATDIGSDDVLITARRMRSLDLIVSVDTMPAHLAGALGLPCVTLLKNDCDWRWSTERDDTPWYPSMRLLRRRAGEDWQHVLDRLAVILITAVPIAATPITTVASSAHGSGNHRSEQTLAKRT
ncbi:glycosyltransferase family 9 protein, partial [Rhodoplanes elegans]